MGYKVITPVAAPVVALALLQIQCKVDVSVGISEQDARILQALSAAREFAEHYTQRSIGVQTLELALDSFPSAGIELPLGAATIDSIKYIDTSTVEQTIPDNLYTLDDYGIKHWAIPVDAWPATGAIANAVKVRYTTPAAIPAAVTQALLLLTAHYFENQQAVLVGNGVAAIEVPLGAKCLLDTVRHWGL